MKIPRDVHGDDLVKALRVLGYEFVRQDGSHMRLSTKLNGAHHITIPKHKPLKTGTLVKGVLKPVAAHHPSDGGRTFAETEFVMGALAREINL